ncbi:DUF6194 family protein [Actibacterium sp. 188UL27-1]|uniref:DUF6194 family protein n=1 Tax=Actibacterium sp. 188UL27-1 TaxID=2786961 RepID=UPI001957C96C|nr:DUF6194 family protein [Actibacterium sp. 188UL27-1]MBM7070376.1 hypothetical protein [Actibacterium sp. 188UL27-1]
MSQNKWIKIETVHNHITSNLDGVMPKEAWGETSYFYNPGRLFDRGTYFATIKQKNGVNDKASDLHRTGIWRLNMGVSKGAYLELFGPPPPRPGKGGIIEGGWDFTTPDVLTPHPIYGWMSRVAILNPSSTMWSRCVSLLEDAHGKARSTFEKRARKSKLDLSN